ncbi:MULTISPECIES: sigma 54-interacting transcriptional regulator [unclassified Myxococcus]|uniref:sigma-54-dependent Fis family transcriptional regulator n=1 Tax=unclassified Myxococcus TaxID=2648731 RepID=UPI00157B3169|nr:MULTISPECIES: sigma 54-interacting transcriptional regulator [unclassified Myxococcus]NTX36047.1 sigma 54-interacting transcriptional regulator [Myxococcus sp. CA033]NTX54313.1 sigma 54-interacting transcriptional regulator [Myxococcus sp. CA039A]
MYAEALQSISLAMAQVRSVDLLLARIVQGLAAQPDVALGRIWLIAPGDLCGTCPMRAECPDTSRCLHLAASAGGSRKSDEAWSGLEGAFRRFPLGVRKVGQVGATGEAVLLQCASGDADWLVRREWARREGIQSFAAQPLVFRGEVLGVLAVFSRRKLGRSEFSWLRAFADHAAVALSNARAFEEVARLRGQLELERDYLREEVKDALSFGEIVGRGGALRRVLQQIQPVAATTASVLILGESGVGKELIARAIHEQSPRRERPLIRVNCASIPRELFESEFFGHVRGAFTGAHRDRAGRFQAADGGTLFLDEVGEIPLELQGKLLRVLQEGSFERVGEDVTRKVDVRIIAATNRDLKGEAAAGRFREDLYYRLSVFPIEVPPLRQRLEDVPLLAEHFLERVSARLKVPVPRMSQAQVQALQRYDWPGNVRELENVLERAVILSRGGRLRLDQALPEGRQPMTGGTASFLTEREWRRREKDNLKAALTAAGGKVYGPGGAAELLGLAPTTLASRLKVLGIKVR